MEELDDLTSLPSPVLVVPGISRGDSLHSAGQVRRMINGCEPARASQPHQHSSHSIWAPGCSGHTQLGATSSF